ncbi:MAG: hypothetical protein Satyrvirus13_3 [Satyrvirus sp.]|uniref:Uncharacterized protein n=1 Tax=Satyrvirus sp. TaxID=2487771 RepID=A0A3G5ADW6_9VIRU|nr:MAG: hypothetical protein Satyrvirus13_3 [Satyrvirus sp.]
MSGKKRHGKKLETDKKTDYLFDYFMNEDKFNEQLRPEWNEEMDKKIANQLQTQTQIQAQAQAHTQAQTQAPAHNIADNKSVKSVKSVKPTKSDNKSSKKKFELKSDKNNNKNESSFSSSDKANISESNSSATGSSTRSSSNSSIYSHKIDAVHKSEHRKDKKILEQKEVPQEEQQHTPPLLGPNLVENIDKYVETPETKRARSREAYSILQDLVDRYDVKLSRNFSIDDDPDEMEAEYKMHKERRHKFNQVKFYKSILLNIVCGVEFLNDKYDPFSFKLKDWSKQVASDMDDYTEILEEIYEKYKDKGGKMAPEIRLLFAIIMSGVTFHLSQSLFGSGGLNDTIKNNPNILNKFLGGLMKGGQGKNDDEPVETKDAPHNNKNILAAIRKHNQNKSDKMDTKSETNTTDVQSETKHKNLDETLVQERERRLLAEQKAEFETRMRKQNEMFMAQIDQLRNQQLNLPQQLQAQTQAQTQAQAQAQQKPILSPSHVNHILSDVNKKPRFQNNPLFSANQSKNKKTNLSEELSDVFNITESDNISKSTSKQLNKQKTHLDELVESLEDTTDIDVNDIIEDSIKKKKSKNNTRSITKNSTKKRGSESQSDALSTTRKKNVINL